MNLKNPFSLYTRELYLYNCYECWECGGNGSGQGGGGIELHHIYGRVSSSPLNSAPLCRSCHSKVKHTYEEHKKYINKTMRFLISQGYELKQTDLDFLKRVSNDLLGLELS